jgi:DNA repair protein RAD50
LFIFLQFGDGGSAAESLSRLRDEESHLVSVVSRADGQIQAEEAQAKTLEDELAAPMYKDAHTNMAKAVARAATLKYVCSDMDRYFRCLDRALMRFHELKLAAINATLAEMWADTYTGNDITSIRIRSDPSDDTDSITLRRKYRYRVLAVRGETEQDMRGRCSSGQKVLACLLIRLALAQHLCTHCGLLALDEPTNHLDDANTHALAEALAKLIEKQRGKRSFQLVIITHDEKFVEKLARATNTEKYHIVHRDHQQHSLIKVVKR